jgi:pimeloyl-ACP methyl ester carboxylesterase
MRPSPTPHPHGAAPILLPQAVEATVQTSSAETRYRRLGRGPTVLLLCAGGIEGAAGALLAASLAERFRVIVPHPPAEPHPPVTRWLRELIDGLGLDRPRLVADEALGVAALGFALLDPERVDRLALVRCGARDAAADEPGVGDRLALSGHALLLLHLDPILRTGGPIEPGARERLLAFLAGDGPAETAPENS